MIIRRARREDIPEIVVIFSLDTLSGHEEIISDPPPEFYFHAFDAIIADVNQVLLIAEHDSKVVGSVQMTFIQNLKSRACRRAVIQSMFVHPSHQGGGVGTALIREAARLASEARCISLELVSNKAREKAHRFYKHLGFKPSHDGFKLSLKTEG